MGGLTRLRMRPDCHWLSRRRETRPVPQAEPVAGPMQVSSPARACPSQSTRPDESPAMVRHPARQAWPEDSHD